MAIYVDLSGNLPLGAPAGGDLHWADENRSNAGNPNNSVTPLYAGEIILDTTTNQLWQAITLNNNGWVPAIVGL